MNREKVYIQSGVNKNYPYSIRVYDPDNEFIIPEWLSDNLRCTGITDDGKICAKIIRNDNSREFYLSDGIRRLHVPFGSCIIQDVKTYNLSVLDKVKLSLLYKEKEPYINPIIKVWRIIIKLIGQKRFIKP